MSDPYTPAISHRDADGGGGRIKYVFRVLSGTNPVRLFSDLGSVRFRSLTMYGFKSFASGVPTNNATDVRFGGYSEEAVLYLPEIISPGYGTQYSPPSGDVPYRLADLWFKGTAADGVLVAYS